MKKYLTSITFFFLLSTSFSQVTIKSSNKINLSKKGLFATTEKIIETVVQATKSENKFEAKKSIGMSKFAEAETVDIYPFSHNLFEEIDNYNIYRQKIIADKSFSITLSFNKLFLPEGAELYIYNPEKTVITGPITSKENISGDRLWSTNSFPGNSVILEMKVPIKEKIDNYLHISKVLFGIPPRKNSDISDSTAFGNFNTSSSCNINILCPDGSPYANEKKAICLIQTNNGEFGSGALVMNTCNTNKPYLLTAWHNTNGRDPNSWTYIFGWWSSSCAPNSNNQQAILFNGATLRATYEPTDFSLLELQQTPASNSDLTYLGWSRSSTIPVTSVGIHHPGGDQMKISFADNIASIGNIRSNSNTAWRVLWTRGIAEPGSSGSPLFDPNKRVIGQFFSITQPAGPPCNQQTGGTNYGRFDLSWTGGGTNSTRLSNWLDPINSGALTSNTTNVNALYDFVSNPSLSISGANGICNNGVSTTYTLNGLPAGATVLWEATLPGQVVISGCSTCVTVNLNKTGTAHTATTLKATVTNCSNSYVITKTIALGSPGAVGIGTYSNMTPCEGDDSYFRVLSAPQPSVYNYSGSLTVGSTGLANSLVWSLPSGYSNNGWTWTASGATVTVSTKQSNTSIRLRATATNSCGTVYKEYSFLSGACNISRIAPQPGFTVQPNPASDNLTVAVNKGNNTFIQEILLKNKMGVPMRTVKCKGNTTVQTIDIQNLIPDVYFVQIFDGKTWVSKKIIKE